MHAKYFPGADCTAVVQYEDGVPTGYIQDAESQKLTHLYMLKGDERGGTTGTSATGSGLRVRGRGYRLRRADALSATSDPVVRHSKEVLSDVHHLVAKAES